MTSFSQGEFEQRYQTGKSAFNAGRYRLSIEQLEQACQLISSDSRVGGEVKYWLVNAYEAAGESEKAIALCQELYTHPHGETKTTSKKHCFIFSKRLS